MRRNAKPTNGGNCDVGRCRQQDDQFSKNALDKIAFSDDGVAVLVIGSFRRRRATEAGSVLVLSEDTSSTMCQFADKHIFFHMIGAIAMKPRLERSFGLHPFHCLLVRQLAFRM